MFWADLWNVFDFAITIVSAVPRILEARRARLLASSGSV
jgi:hypothetical protein